MFWPLSYSNGVAFADTQIIFLISAGRYLLAAVSLSFIVGWYCVQPWCFKVHPGCGGTQDWWFEITCLYFYFISIMLHPVTLFRQVRHPEMSFYTSAVTVPPQCCKLQLVSPLGLPPEAWAPPAPSLVPKSFGQRHAKEDAKEVHLNNASAVFLRCSWLWWRSKTLLIPSVVWFPSRLIRRGICRSCRQV